jgi:hypothetical protein
MEGAPGHLLGEPGILFLEPAFDVLQDSLLVL